MVGMLWTKWLPIAVVAACMAVLVVCMALAERSMEVMAFSSDGFCGRASQTQKMLAMVVKSACSHVVSSGDPW
jgi:hypothetical protein